MTNEEIIAILESYKNYEDSRTEDLLHHGYDNTKEATKRKEALDKAIKAISENKGEWIPVSERLPEKNVWVLVTVEQNEMRYQEIMRRNNYKEGWTDNINFYTDEITAWQPLPEPYKEGGNE